MWRSKSATIYYPIFHFDVGFFKIVIDNNSVVGTRLLRVLELILCLCQALVQAILGLRTAAAQATLQLLKGRWCQEKEASVEIAELDLLHTLESCQSLDSHINVNKSPASTYLHLDIKNTDPLLLCNGLHGLLASTVVVAAKLSVLYKAIFGNEIEEVGFRDKVVGDSVLLTGARGTSSV